MKKILALILSLVMCMCLFTACDEDNTPVPANPSEKVTDMADNGEKETEEVSYTDDELEQMIVGEWYNIGDIDSFGVNHEYIYAEDLDHVYVFNADGSYMEKSVVRDYTIPGRFMIENGVLYLSKSEFLFDVKWEGDILVLVSDYSNTGHMYSRKPELMKK